MEIKNYRCMKTKNLRVLAVFLFSGTSAIFCQDMAVQFDPAQEYLVPIGHVSLEGVEGRLDHLTADPVSQRLFATGLENHTIEVIDLAGRKRIRQIQEEALEKMRVKIEKREQPSAMLAE